MAEAIRDLHGFAPEIRDLPTTTTVAQRYNWHPAVHARFGEQLYYYLIRLRQPLHRPVADQLRELLQQADVRFACEYSVFGHWDGLIRAWLPPASHHRLLLVFNEPSANVAEVVHFQATRIRHLWDGNDRDLLAYDIKRLEAITERFADIRHAASEPDNADADVLSRLLEADLLLKRPLAAPGAVKFYVCLRSTGGEIRTDADEAAVLSAVKSAGLASRSSLYMGAGHLADYLVRCVADTYHDVLDWSVRLDENLGDKPIRPITLLIANSDARESDNLNDLNPLSSDDEANLALLGLTDTALIGPLSPEQRSALSGLVRTAFELSERNPTLRGRLRNLLRASIQNDRDQVAASLAFLLDFEWFLGEYLKRAWADVYDSGWMTVLAEMFSQQERTVQYATRVTQPNDWTLGLCVHMAIEAAELDETFSARLNQQLGRGWKGQLRTIVERRNLLAHGRLRRIDSLDDFAGEWGAMLRDLMGAATLHFRCERLVEGVEASAR